MTATSLVDKNTNNYFTKIHKKKMTIISKFVVALFLDKQKDTK